MKYQKHYYAVRIGREGPRIYDSWEKVLGFSGASYKGFKFLNEAEEWLRFLPHTSNPISIDHNIPRTEAVVEEEGPKEIPEEIELFLDLPEYDDISPPSNSYVPDIKLSPTQQYVFDKVMRGESVFFTGPAGTGKSVLLRSIIQSLRYDRYGGDSLYVTASTGIAALNIGGTTLHSFAGVGLGKEPVDRLFFRARALQREENWQNCSVLIIDEISMVDGALFDKLEELARMFRKSKRPFGGIQLVISGDFFQLPPVSDSSGEISVPPLFAFEAKCWNRCISSTIILDQVFRQQEQPFVNLLNEMRHGTLSPPAIEMLRGLSRAVKYPDGIEPTELYPLRREVENANARRLATLDGNGHRYIAADIPGYDAKGERFTQKEATILLDKQIAPQDLTLKIGAQVMLIKNLPNNRGEGPGLVNGSVGKVINFWTYDQAQEASVSVIKSDSKPDNRSRFREESRSTSNTPFNKGRVWPLVEFTNGRQVLCNPHQFESQDAVGRLQATREQVPLILAWAMSIHKSQGQTLERVKIDLSRAFEKGQVYVAISRATSLESLQITGFDPAKVLAHPRVSRWYAELERELVRQQQFEEEMDCEEALSAFYG